MLEFEAVEWTAMTFLFLRQPLCKILRYKIYFLNDVDVVLMINDYFEIRNPMIVFISLENKIRGLIEPEKRGPK